MFYFFLFSTTLSAFAASEKRVEIEGSEGSYITISNVVKEKKGRLSHLFITNAPVTVKFEGDRLMSRYIHRAENIYEGWQGKFEDMKIEDNFTILGPGIYTVHGSPDAGVGTNFIIQVFEESTVKPNPKPFIVAPATSKVLVNGNAITFEAYNIHGNNYFKLRDLAMALNGSKKNFEVGWDSQNNTIKLTLNKAYSPIGKELAVNAPLSAKQAYPTESKMYVNAQEVEFTAYNINGNNYFKLLDIAKEIGFGVTWNADENTISIDTKAE